MKTVLRLTLLLALIAAGYWLWTVMSPSPQVVIRKRLQKMAQIASFSPGQGMISKVAAIERLGTFFSEDAEVVVDVPGVGSHVFNRREEINQALMAAKSSISSLKAEFPDINVEVAPSKLSAIASLTLEASVNGQKDLIVQELRLSIKKINGDWLVTKVETVRTLK
jgi:hypothetical protein